MDEMDLDQMADDVMGQQNHPRINKLSNTSPYGVIENQLEPNHKEVFTPYVHNNILDDIFTPKHRKNISPIPSENFNTADERILPVIEKMNKKGYATIASCAGYEYPGHCIDPGDIASPYILFKNPQNIDKIIKGTEWHKEQGYRVEPPYFNKKIPALSIHLFPPNREEYYSNYEKNIPNKRGLQNYEMEYPRKKSLTQWKLLEENLDKLL